MRLSIKSLIGALVVLTSAVAHADSTTSVPAFEAESLQHARRAARAAAR